MSTELSTVMGRIEIPLPALGRSTYANGKMYITSFSDGENGRMLQITLPQNHIQLTKQQVSDLIAALSEWAD